jgi:hypothetical protein
LPHACVPGRDHVPAWIRWSICDHSWQTGYVGHSLWSLLGHLGAAWPVLLPVAAVVVAAVFAAGRVAARHHVTVASQGHWVEISCPAEANSDGAAVLWRLLARRLVSGRFSMRRRVIAWELHAGPAGIRAGLWGPRDVSSAAVVAAVSDAWPGAQAHGGSSGKLPALPQSPLTAVRLRPAAPDWLPVTAVDRLASRRAYPHEADVLRAVFGSLAACRAVGGYMTVQVLVRRASKRRERRAGAALRHLRGLPPKRGIVRGAVLGFLDFVTGTDRSQPQRSPLSPQMTDPLGLAQVHALAAKAAARPHFEVSVRIAATAGTVAKRRDLAGAVVAGFDLTTLGAPIPADLVARRLFFPAERLAGRYASRRHWFLASLPEVAVLANLPARPASYGLKVATARRFPPPPEALAA